MDAIGLTRRPASARSADAGLTLIEVVVAIAIIGGALLTVLAAATSGFAFQSMARQRQSAVAVANKIVEELRARPYSQVVLPETLSTKDAHSQKCRKNVLRLVACTGDGVTSGSGEPIVNRESGTVSLNKITYTWYAYISRLSPAAPYRLTVFADWTWKGRPFSVNVQTMLWSPDGCNGSGTHPVSGPCTGGQTLAAEAKGVKVTVSAEGLATPVSVPLGYASATYASEQSLRVSGSYTVPEVAPITRSVEADNDTSNGLSAQSELRTDTATSSTIQTGSSFTFSGATWILDATYSVVPSVTGKVRAGVSDGVVDGTCSTTSATGSPCVGAQVAPDASTFLRMRARCTAGCPAKLTGISTGALYLVEVRTPWSVVAQAATSGGTTTLTASRSVGDVKLGPVGYPTSSSSSSYAWISTTGTVTDTVTGVVGSELTAPAMPSHPLTTYGPSAGAASDCGTWSGSVNILVGSWPAGTSRCLSYATYSVAANGPVVSKFTNMTYTLPTVGVGQLTGATLAYDVQLQYCTATSGGGPNKACSTWAAVTPLFHVTVEFPLIRISGGSTQW